MFKLLRAIWPKGYQSGSLFALLVLSSRRSGGPSLGFRAGSFWACTKARKRLNIKTLAQQTSKHHN